MVGDMVERNSQKGEEEPLIDPDMEDGKYKWLSLDLSEEDTKKITDWFLRIRDVRHALFNFDHNCVTRADKKSKEFLVAGKNGVQKLPNGEHYSKIKCPKCGNESLGKIFYQHKRVERTFVAEAFDVGTSDVTAHADTKQSPEESRYEFVCKECKHSWPVPKWLDPGKPPKTVHPVIRQKRPPHYFTHKTGHYVKVKDEINSNCGRKGKIVDHGPSTVMVLLEGDANPTPFYPNELGEDRYAYEFSYKLYRDIYSIEMYTSQYTNCWPEPKTYSMRDLYEWVRANVKDYGPFTQMISDADYRFWKERVCTALNVDSNILDDYRAVENMHPDCRLRYDPPDLSFSEIIGELKHKNLGKTMASAMWAETQKDKDPGWVPGDVFLNESTGAYYTVEEVNCAGEGTVEVRYPDGRTKITFAELKDEDQFSYIQQQPKPGDLFEIRCSSIHIPPPKEKCFLTNKGDYFVRRVIRDARGAESGVELVPCESGSRVTATWENLKERFVLKERSPMATPEPNYGTPAFNVGRRIRFWGEENPNHGCWGTVMVANPETNEEWASYEVRWDDDDPDDEFEEISHVDCEEDDCPDPEGIVSPEEFTNRTFKFKAGDEVLYGGHTKRVTRLEENHPLFGFAYWYRDVGANAGEHPIAAYRAHNEWVRVTVE